MNRFNIVVMADLHAGSNLALCNPEVSFEIEVPVEDEDSGFIYHELEMFSPELSPVQQLLWEKYLSAKHDFLKIAGKDPVFLICLGEVCEGTYYANSSVRLKKDEQVKIAEYNMDPWLNVKNLEAIRICPGDRPHEFDEGSAARMVANSLRKSFKNVKSVGHGVLDIEGFKIDYAHRGPGPGIRKWTEGNVARYYLTDYMMREKIEFNREPVDLLLRAHYHVPITERRELRSGQGTMKSALMVSSSMKFPDAYAKTVTQNKFSSTIGMSMIEVADNKILDFHHRFTTVDTRAWEVYDGK